MSDLDSDTGGGFIREDSDATDEEVITPVRRRSAGRAAPRSRARAATRTAGRRRSAAQVMDSSDDGGQGDDDSDEYKESSSAESSDSDIQSVVDLADSATSPSDVEVEEPAPEAPTRNAKRPRRRGKALEQPAEGDDANAAPTPRKKAKKKAPSEKMTPQKRFDRMDADLKEHHPELRDVFDKLENDPVRPVVAMDEPPALRTSLLPFQKEGLNWLIEQERSHYGGGILADEMGMGKTIQTISLFLSDTERSGPILVVAPTVAVMQWKNEIQQYAGDALSVLVYHGANRSNDAKEIGSHDVVLTTYAVLESVWRKQRSGFVRKGNKIKEKSVLHNMHFHRVVLDEAHNIKDRHASTTVAVFHIQADYRLCLSGTPLQNRIGELYSLLRFLQVEPFCQYFCTKCDCKSNEWNIRGQRCLTCGHVAMQHVNFFNHSLLKHILRLDGQQQQAIAKMRLLLSRIMLRRTKVERADDLGLPPRVVTVRRDYFNEEEKDLYASVFGDSRRTFSTYVNQGVVLNNYANIFTLITRMRQIADHPDLVLRRAGAAGTGDAHVEGIVCRLCDDEAEEPIRSRCHHTFCRMCIREYVEGWTGAEADLECPVCHVALSIDLDGPAVEVDHEVAQKGSIVNRIRMDDSWRSSTKIEALLEELFRLRSDRQTIKSIVFSQFTSMLDLVEWRLGRAGFKCVKLQGSMSPTQRDSIIQYFMDTPSVEVFLVSLKAGGVALNLCEASQVFLLDPWWNPSVEWQSGDRVHRIGQHRPVTITRLVIEDSIESRIIELQEKKANMINATIGSDDAALNRLTQGDMEFLFQN